MKHYTGIFFICFASIACAQQSISVPEIKVDEVRRIESTLSSDQMEGRKVFMNKDLAARYGSKFSQKEREFLIIVDDIASNFYHQQSLHIFLLTL